ncbi:AEC family transporter [Campylobacter cuniculorum]|uniref:AEC family transporter n=1 Tax=Campylobacter cuniculorum TaxID=374106 RepID=UPI0023F2C627|nr:AEC family transporter [Campylobacter cuniculorum]
MNLNFERTSLIFTPLFTLFALLFGGYFAKRLRILKQKQATTFLNFVVFFALPCLIFDKVYHLNFDFSLILFAFMGFLSCVVAAFFALVLGFLFQFTQATLASMFLLSCFSNNLFIGLPIVAGIYEDTQALSVLVFYDILATTLPISLFGTLILSLASKNQVNFKENIKKIFTFPPFLALLFAFFCRFFHLNEVIFAPIRLLGDSTTAIALFAIGLGFSFKTIKTSYKAAMIVIIAKMILAPLLFILLLKIFNFDFKQNLIVCIIACATPTMVLAGVMVMRAKLDSNLAVSVIAFSTLFTFINMPILLNFLI